MGGQALVHGGKLLGLQLHPAQSGFQRIRQLGKIRFQAAGLFVAVVLAEGHKIVAAPLQKLAQPIVSLRWRRVTFVHTTWDRFKDATEINDLFIEGGPYADRLYATLKERGIHPERNYHVDEGTDEHVVALSVPTRDGRVNVSYGDLPASDRALMALAEALVQEIARQGGLAEWRETPPLSTK